MCVYLPRKISPLVIIQYYLHGDNKVCTSASPKMKGRPKRRHSFLKLHWIFHHYNDVIMSAMASQILSLTIVYLTVYSGADQRKHQSSASLAFVTGEFPAQMASNAENVSIWWRHHDFENLQCSLRQQDRRNDDPFVLWITKMSTDNVDNINLIKVKHPWATINAVYMELNDKKNMPSRTVFW